ncbi:MAG: NUDIX hydrolase [Dehalococcoidia bacterium]|nr:NUDIX hydrolase [Dehalococcoidia bacterium]
MPDPAPFPTNEPTLASRSIFKGRVVGLRVDDVRLPDGKTGTREIIEHADAVVVAPLDAKGRVLLVRQYRKPIEQALLELPAGGLDGNESPADGAIRELQEEIGHYPGTLTPLGGFYAAPGYCQEFLHLFLATDLRPSKLAHDDDEHIEVETVPLDEALAMVESGAIRDAKSVAGLLRVWRHLMRAERPDGGS